jgi:hypothetical protein
MTSVHEPALHALSVERRVARPGETVCVIFRTRNLGTSASPPGTVAFLLGEGLEALDAAECAVESVAPGDDVVAMMHARVAAPLDDRTELTVQAVLRVPDAVLGTNVCTVLVRSRAVLDGAGSGTFVELVDAERVRVRAIVSNEGDGAARDVRVVVPAPAGCVRTDGDGPAIAEVERLEAGASAAVAFEARIVAPVAVLAADDGEVRCGAGRCCVLPVREVVVMEPVIVAPCVAVRPSRRSVDVAVDIRNDGWVDARDVRVRVALPAPMRAIDGSITVDGAPVAARGGRRSGGDPPFARVERAGGAHVVVAPVPARTTARIALTATFPGGCADGTIVAGAGQHEVAATFVPELARDVRMRLLETPRSVVRDDDIRAVVEVVNAGDVAEGLFFCIAGSGIVVAPEAVARTLAPGSVAVVELAVRANPAAPADEQLVLSVVACDAERERARAEFAVVVRDRTVSCCDDTTDADESCMPAVVHAALHAPDEVSAGAAFSVRADIDVEDFVEMLTVRVRDVVGARYVPGSTLLGGRSLLDRAGTSPLAGDGLLLRGVAAGTRVSAAWTLLADPTVCDEALIVEAGLDVDGEERLCEPIAVHVRGREAFATRPGGLPYHVEACVIDVGSPAIAPETRSPAIAPEGFESPRETTSTEASQASAFVEDSMLQTLPVGPPQLPPDGDDAFTFSLRLDAAPLDDVARLLDAGGGLVSHILALRVFLADGETSGDLGVASALDGVGQALRDVFDRLFVKLRIPGFDVTCDDVDDVVLRSAMIGLFERLRDAWPGGDCYDGATARITRDRVRELLAAFSNAPYGAPVMLRALVALLPTRCEHDPALGAALARYAIALDDALARYEGMPLELFDDALARGSDRALDDARTALAAALRGCTAMAELAC